MEQLWSKRFSTFIQDRIFLLRRLANGFAFLPIIVLMIGLYYYPIVLDTIPEQFPVTLMLAIIIAFSVARGSYRSFLLESDVVYLAPVESSMKPFFTKAYIYNVIVQAFFAFALLVILSPLYFDRVSGELRDYVLFVAIVLLLKAWNLYLLWTEIKGENRTFTYLRRVFNFTFMYGLLEQQLGIMLISLVLVIGMYWIMRRTIKSKRIHWLQLVQMEQQLNAQFYRWMGQFVDHPNTESKIKKRNFLNQFINGFPKKHENAFAYVYMKLFIRTETVGIVFRITILGMIALIFVQSPYVAYALYFVLLIMIGMQLLAFWPTYSNNFWMGLYPIAQATRTKDFIASSFYTMLMGAVLLPILFVITQFTWLNLLIFSLMAIAIPYIFIHQYMAKKLS